MQRSGHLSQPLITHWPPLQDDCHKKIDELFSGKLYLIGIAAIVVAVIMVSGVSVDSAVCLSFPVVLTALSSHRSLR